MSDSAKPKKSYPSVSVRFFGDDQAHVKRSAALSGLSVSELIRAVATGMSGRRADTQS